MNQPVTLETKRGDTLRQAFQFWSDAAKTQPHDLTGVTVAAEVRTQSGSTPIGTFACTVTLPNSVLLHATPTQTRALPDVALWDLQLTYPSGDVYTRVEGLVRAFGDITASSAPAMLRAEKLHV